MSIFNTDKSWTMNLSNFKIKSSLFVLLLGLLPLFSAAQDDFYERIEVLVGETYEYEFNSYPHFPQIVDYPFLSLNGAASLGGAPSYIGFPGDNTLSYQSEQIGVDYFTLKYYVGNSPFTYEVIEKGFQMVVKPSIITTTPDYYTAFVNSPITLDVLDNDELANTTGSSMSELFIRSVPIANNGTAIVTGETNSEILFTPAEDFTGTTHLNYLVCDGIGTCELGEVTVFVKGVNPPGVQEVQLTTVKNQDLDVYISLDFGHQLNDPGHGDLEVVANGHIIYTPQTGYTGTDNFSVVSNTDGSAHITEYEITIVDIADGNEFAFDDYAYTEIGHPVTVYVTDNDYDFSLTNPVVTDNPSNGNIVANGPGSLTYKPHENFEGKDQFTYRVCSQPSFDCEFAVVTVEVSNQHPVQTTFELTTPVNTPLVLEYDAIINDYDFQLTDNANNGYVNIYSGETLLNVNGQEVFAVSPLLYTPNESFVGLDEFELLYCVDNDCRTVKIKVLVTDEYEGENFCVGDCVWAGDTNNDGKVDMKDILPLGLCMGELGVERPDGSVNWYPQYSGEWENAFGFAPPVDLMYVDADGDGIVHADDVAAVDEHYGLCHDITSARAVAVEELFALNQKTPNPGPGDLVEIDILLGYNTATTAIDKYGLTFSVDYVASAIKEGSFKVEMLDDSWLAYGSPMLSLVKEPHLGSIDVGFTRTNGHAVSGHGKIGKISFIVIDDNINGFRTQESPHIDINLKAGTTMEGSGHYVRGNDVELTVPISLEFATDLADASHLDISPNPASDMVNIHLNGFNTIKEFGLYSITGQQVYQSQGIYAKQTQLDVSEYQSGFYIIRAITEKGTISKKLEITRN